MEKIDFFSKMSAVLKDCENEVINLIKSNGGKIELPVNDNNLVSMVLPTYFSNGDICDSTITSIRVISSNTGDWLELETEDNEVKQLGAFADNPILYIYDYIYVHVYIFIYVHI